MNTLVQDEISKTLDMQLDLLKDGEMPPSLMDYDYLKGYYMDCEELSEQLAAAMAQSIVDSVEIYTADLGYNTLTVKIIQDYTQLTLLDSEGDTLVRVCYDMRCNESRILVLMGLVARFPKVMVL